jgi:hypothetical protein
MQHGFQTTKHSEINCKHFCEKLSSPIQRRTNPSQFCKAGIVPASRRSFNSRTTPSRSSSLNGSKYSARDIDCAARSVASPTPKPLLTQIRLGAEPTSAKFLVPSQNKKLLYGAPGLLNRAVPLLTINSVLEKHLPEASISSRWTRMDSI